MSLMKVCVKCNKEKNFPEGFRSSSNRCKVCLECSKEVKRKIGSSDNKRNNQYLKRYKITLDDYEKMLKIQNYCCAICTIHISELSSRLHVDHCHNTNKVRGLLCYNCNSGIGRFKDDESLLIKAADYIKCSE